MGNIKEATRQDIAAITEFWEDLASKADSIGEIDYKLERLPLNQVLLNFKGTQLSSGTGMASAPFVKLASSARKRLEFLDKAGSDIRNRQEGAEAQSQEGEARS